MICLQCNGTVTGTETIGGREVRVCADGHRTALATRAEVKWSQTARALSKAAKNKKWKATASTLNFSTWSVAA